MEPVDSKSEDDVAYLAVIEAIATETRRSEDEVRHIYDQEFARLAIDARVKDFLVLFASRATRDVLLGRRA